MIAILDVRTMAVYDPGLSSDDSKYRVQMDPTSEMNVEFRIDSRLLVFERLCRESEERCGTYYFEWKDGRTELRAVTPSSRTESVIRSSRDTPKQRSHLPRFDEYPVVTTFNGTPIAPLFTRPEERRYRTTIRRGVSNGDRVEDGQTGNEMKGPGPNFAGRYVVVKWGCGTDCGEMAIVDATTGHIYQPPFAQKRDGYFWYPTRFSMPPQYRLDSRLFIMPNICADNVADCGTYYFVWEDNRWRQVHWEPLPPGVMQPFY